MANCYEFFGCYGVFCWNTNLICVVGKGRDYSDELVAVSDEDCND